VRTGLLFMVAVGCVSALAAGLASAGSGATARLAPTARNVDYSDGPVTFRVLLENLRHDGSIGYDDNRDTVPDRFVPSRGLAAYEIELRYHSGVMEVIGAEAGDILRQDGRSVQCFERRPEPGLYMLGCASIGDREGPQGGGELARIRVRPLANGTSFINLHVELGGPLGDDIPVEVTGHGVVEVQGAPRVAPTPTPTSGGPGEGTEDGNSGPDVIGGGNPGELDPPEGYNPDEFDDEVSGSGDEDSAGANGEGFPSAGGGYPERQDPVRTLAIAGALAAAGLALVAGAARLARRSEE
jgi:hypothetical protein